MSIVTVSFEHVSLSVFGAVSWLSPSRVVCMQALRQLSRPSLWVVSLFIPTAPYYRRCSLSKSADIIEWVRHILFDYKCGPFPLLCKPARLKVFQSRADSNTVLAPKILSRQNAPQCFYRQIHRFISRIGSRIPRFSGRFLAIEQVGSGAPTRIVIAADFETVVTHADIRERSLASAEWTSLQSAHAGTFAISRAYVRRLPTMASTNDASRSRLWRFTLPSFSLKVNSSMYRERCLGLA